MQEGTGVTFDIAYPRPEFARGELVILFGLALVGYAAFRGFGWLLRRYREQFPWRRLRVWWPIVTTAWVSATWFALRFAAPEGMWLILLGGGAWSLTVLNLPATMTGLLVMNSLEGLSVAWLRDGCTIFAYCVAGYGWIRLLEWYAWRKDEVRLNLRGIEEPD